MKKHRSFAPLYLVSSLLLLSAAADKSSLPSTPSGAPNAGAVQEQKAEEKPVESPKKALVPNHPRQVLKFGKHFLLLDDLGLMPDSKYGYGLYCDDTRYLSKWDVRIGPDRMTLLYSDTSDGYAARYVYGNADGVIPAEKIMVERRVLISDRVRERIRVTNYDTISRTVPLKILYSGDFADMFEVRGQNRPRSGNLLPVATQGAGDRITLGYQGLDNRILQTFIGFSKPPHSVRAGEAEYLVSLKPQASWEVEASVATDNKVELFTPGGSFAADEKAADNAYAAWLASCASISSDSALFNHWIDRSFRDLYILRQPTPKGNGIAAGVPWFAVAFGRDQEITSLETLPFMPQLTRDVLEVLCRYQGIKEDPFTQEKPGRIMHELRLGEMARMREIPFIPYYGTIDATPLFLVLLGRYVDTTDDIAFVESHWGYVQHALDYLGRETKDGYLRYGWDKNSALSNIGWKDSGDSVMFGNGQLVKVQPIALCEVQGYLYQSWRSAAKLAARLRKDEQAKLLNDKADALRTRFQKDFWNEKLNFVALALDGENNQCDVVSSNPGHLLSSGILAEKQEKQVAQRLMQPDMYSGWGIRTLSQDEVAFNPLSYHDGSVWPHDNAVITSGLAEAGRTDLAAKVLGSMLQVAAAQPDLRLPELFCGFPRSFSEKPIWYPVSCSPQAWAAGSVFMMLQGSLGLAVDANHHKVVVDHPHLPEGLSRLELHGLKVGDRRVNLIFSRRGETVDCQMPAVEGVVLDLVPSKQG